MPRPYLISLVFSLVIAAGLALASAAALPSPPVRQWVQTYNGTGNNDDRPYDIEVDAAGNSYVTGGSSGMVNGSSTSGDCVTIKYGPDGTQQWLARYNATTTGSEVGYALAVDAGGNVYVTGSSEPPGNNGRDVILLKYSPDGTQQWVRAYTGTGYQADDGRCLVLDSMGNPVVAGTTTGLNNDIDWVVLKYSSSGDLLWTDRYGFQGAPDSPAAIRVDASDQVYVCGMAGTDAVVLKYTAGGTRLWVAADGSSPANLDGASDLVIDGAENVYLCGIYGRNNSTTLDAGVVKFNASGVPQWIKYYDGPTHGNDAAEGIRVDSQGNVYTTLQSSEQGSNGDVVTLKYSSTGEFQWRAVYQRSSTSNDVPIGLELDAAGQPWVVAQTTGTTQDVTALKYDGEGNLLWQTHYNGPGNNADFPNDFVLGSGTLYLAGATIFSDASSWDYLTLKLAEPPAAADDSYSLDEDETLELASPGVLTNDADPQGDSLTAVWVSGPSHGTIQLRANGSFHYVPDADYVGSDNFAYQATDGTSSSSSATVTLSINAVNDAPVAQNDSYSTDEDQELSVAAPGVLGNDVDLEDDPLTVSLVSGPGSGTLQLNADGSFQYTPAPNFHGSTSFSYRVSDGSLDSNTATVSLTVRPVNDPPTAAGQTVTTAEDTARLVTLAGADVDGDALSYVVGQPAHGTLSGTAPDLTYTPAQNYSGPDSFTFRVEDGAAQSNLTTVEITVTPVNDAPLGLADRYDADEDTTLVVPATQGVLINDGDVDGDPLTASVKTLPTHGTLALGNDGGFTYTPALNYHGSDEFTYVPRDGTADGAPVLVSLQIASVNDAPVAVDQAASTEEDTAKPLTLSASDVDGDPLTYQVVTGPAHGILSGEGASRTYTPQANYYGADRFTFRVDDGTAQSEIATVEITVTPINDAPLGLTDRYDADEDTALVVPAAQGVLLNDGDVDGDLLTASVKTPPAHGTLALGNDGGFTYTPALNYHGSDEFTYVPRDGTADGAPVLVSLQIASVNDAPVAVDQAASTEEDTAKPLTLSASDVDGDPLTYQMVTGPAHGTVSGEGTSRTYTPLANYYGADSFTFRVGDGIAESNLATVTLTVTAVNDAPVALDGSVNTDEDTQKSITLGATDTDGDGLTVAVLSSPLHGTLTGEGASRTYHPTPNYYGPDQFTFQVNDGSTDSNVATVSIEVGPVNDAPVAQGQRLNTDEDTPVAVTLVASDVEADPLTYLVVTSPAHGTLSGTAPQLTYTPARDYAGPDEFTFRARDGAADSELATVTLTIAPVNDAPAGVPDRYRTDEDASLLVLPAQGVLANDVDAESEALTVSLVAGPDHGTLTLTPEGGFTYQPQPDYHGPDGFTYRPSDGTAAGATTLVELVVSAVNDAPSAAPQAGSTEEDMPLPLTLSGADVDGDPLTFEIVAAPVHGTLSGAGANRTYTPAANYAGPDGFTFRVNDGTVTSNTATVSITVTPVNDAPIAQDQSQTTPEDTARSLTLGAADVEGDPLTYTRINGPLHGTVTGVAPVLTYTPQADYSGPDSFTFRVSDGNADSNVATVSLTVLSVNDAPVARTDSYNGTEDAVLTVPAPGVLANDSDVEGDFLSAAVVASPRSGSLTLNVDGGFRYTPNRDFRGTDSFTYRAGDGQATSAVTTVTLTLAGVNDAPVAVAQTLTTAEDTAKPLTLSGTDVDGDPLTYQVVISPGHGALTGTPPSLTYRPAANYAGSDSFTFRVTDGATASTPATVSLTVTPVNDAPVAVAESYSTPEDQPLDQAGSGVLANDLDVDGDSLSAVPESGPAHGTLVLRADGSFRYTPNTNFAGDDQFRYRAGDGEITSAAVTVSLRITSVNDSPVANAQQVTTTEDTSVGITLTGGDVDGDGLTYEVLGLPEHGSLTGTAPNLTYVPAPNYAGSDHFTFRVSDGTAGSSAARVDLQVSPVNDPPVAGNDQYAVAEDMVLSVSSGAGVLVNDTDVDGDALTATVLEGPAHGLLMLQADGSLTYVPVSDYSGPDQFTYRCGDGAAQSVGATVNLLVTPVNDAPVSQPGAVTLNEDTPAAVKLAAADADGDPLTYQVATTPAHGTLTGTAPNLTYTPSRDYAGPDQFTFRAGDGTAESDFATVTLAVTAVNDAPLAKPDAFQTGRATLIAVAAPGLLGNDTDAEGDSLQAVLVSGPTQGQLQLLPDGSFRYTSRIGFSGTEQFTYRASDGPLQSEPTTVQIVVSDAPPASTSGKVTGKGALGTGAAKATFALQAGLDRRGRLKGQFTYQNKSTRQTVKSTRLTAVVITGNRARVFGKARVNKAGEFDFVVDVFDGGEPSVGVDEFGLEVASGPSVVPTKLASGKIVIRP